MTLKPLQEFPANSRLFLKWLGEDCKNYGWKVHAWVLMGSHFQLLRETPGNEPHFGNVVARGGLCASLESEARSPATKQKCELLRENLRSQKAEAIRNWRRKPFGNRMIDFFLGDNIDLRPVRESVIGSSLSVQRLRSSQQDVFCLGKVLASRSGRLIRRALLLKSCRILYVGLGLLSLKEGA